MPVNVPSHVKAAQAWVAPKSLTGRTRGFHFKTSHEMNTLELGADVFFALSERKNQMQQQTKTPKTKPPKPNTPSPPFSFGHVSESNQSSHDLAREKHLSRRLWRCVRAKECMTGCSGKEGAWW